MPNYRLVYFNARGRAEPARILFHLKGQDFVDDRFSYEDWPKLKENKKEFPMGKGPILHIDKEVIPQSRAIWRYLGKTFGYFGRTEMEEAKNDVIIETVTDIELKMMPHYLATDDAKRAELIQAFKETTSKPFYSYLRDEVKANGGKYFIGNEISLADIVVFNHLDIITDSTYKIEGVLDQYPNLVAFYEAFREDPRIKSYIENRPTTPA
ncbi:glutathione S-transferase 1-like [Diadema setosum]|uniref:glutathione S-transferase 1-like n=1 Tax=Diadema setosum TaxID=31175 RepID=UPI003B3A0407